MKAKSNYFTPTKNPDITFCKSNCNNKECSRNIKGEIFKYADRNWYSCSDFSDNCKEYKR